MLKQPTVIVVEALIGAGKTTLLKCLENFWRYQGLSVVTIPEPVELWKNLGILQKFYKNPKKNAYKFQTFTYVTRLQALNKAYVENPSADIYLLERSIYSDRYFFVDMLIENGMISNLEKEMYETWCDAWKNMLPFHPSKFIYLKPSVDECMKRLRERNRDGEAQISKDYQLSLQEKHNKFFENGDHVFVGDIKIPAMVIQTDEDFRNDPHVLEGIASTILSGIEK